MGLIGKKILKRAQAMEKGIHELKGVFAYLISWEKKINSYEITVIILKVFKKCKKGRTSYQKHPFFFTLETVLKMAKWK